MVHNCISYEYFEFNEVLEKKNNAFLASREDEWFLRFDLKFCEFRAVFCISIYHSDEEVPDYIEHKCSTLKPMSV